MLIARLRGTVDDVGLDSILIDVGGLGYPLLVSARTRAALPPAGDPATLLIETQLREDSIVYFGFIDRAERDWFRLLTTVQGVGGKVALNILSVLEPALLAKAIALQDRPALCRADGVGTKLAARIVTELKEKTGIVASSAVTAALRDAVDARTPIIIDPGSEALRDAVAALVALQFKPGEAEMAVAAARRRCGADVAAAELIRAALQESAR